MTVPAYNVNSARPRLFMSASEKAAITTRTNDTAGWKTFWDGEMTSRANTLKAKTDAALVGVSDADHDLMVLSLYGYIEETGRPAGGYKAKAISGAVYLAGLADNVLPTNPRARIAALFTVFDFLYDDMTTAERDTIAAELIQQQARMTKSSTELMDGHSGTDQTLRIMAMLTLHGYSTYAAQALTNLNDAMTWWYGANPNEGRIEMLRYQYTNGGADKGSWYFFQAFWGECLLMQALTKGTDYNAWSAESVHLRKIWEWLIWVSYRGGVDDDYEHNGDTAKVTAPRMHYLMRWAFGLLATNYPTPDSTEGGKHLRWLYDTWDAQQSEFADDKCFDVIFLDRAAVAPVAPSAAASLPATARLFDPPGTFFYRRAERGSGNSNWDYDQTMVARINARRRYRQGHPHLDQGSLQLRWKDDILLQAPAGYYDDFSTSHHVDAYQRGWLQSLCPLIHDTGAIYQRYSQAVVNDGGPHFKKAVRGGTTISDPDTVANMLGEGGGEAWLCCRKFSEVSEDANHVFISLDSADAYDKFHTDTPRCPVLQVRYLFIEPTAANGMTWPAILYYARIKKRDPAWKVQIPFHCGAAITTQSYGFTALGYRTTAGNGSPGKLWVDVRNIGAYTLLHNTPGTPADSNGYGPDQFKVAGTGVSRPPGAATPSRHLLDLKSHSLYLEKTTKVEEEHYVVLIGMSPAAGGDPFSSRAWLTDAAQPNHYGLTINGQQYMIHRTQDQAVIGTPDTTAPANVTGMTVTGRDGELLVQWTDPADSDLDAVDIEYRTAAT